MHARGSAVGEQTGLRIGRISHAPAGEGKSRWLVVLDRSPL